MDWFGLATDRPRVASEDKPKKQNRKVPQDQQNIARALAILQAKDAERRNQSTAGQFLESRPDLMGRATDGRQIVRKLIACGLLGTDKDRKVIASKDWNDGMSRTYPQAVA